MIALRNALFLIFFSSARLFAQDDSVSLDKEDALALIPVSQTFKDKQDGKLYRLNYAVDLPIIGVFGGTSIYLMTIIYSKKATPVDEILKLDKNNVPSFDRWEAGV